MSRQAATHSGDLEPVHVQAFAAACQQGNTAEVGSLLRAHGTSLLHLPLLPTGETALQLACSAHQYSVCLQLLRDGCTVSPLFLHQLVQCPAQPRLTRKASRRLPREVGAADTSLDTPSPSFSSASLGHSSSSSASSSTDAFSSSPATSTSSESLKTSSMGSGSPSISGNSRWERVLKHSLRSGLVINATDPSTGNSALHVAVSSTEPSVAFKVRALLQNGATASLRNSNGDTSLHLLIRADHSDSLTISVMDLLLGASTSLLIKSSSTSGSPIELAQNLGRAQIVEYLTTARAKQQTESCERERSSKSRSKGTGESSGTSSSSGSSKSRQRRGKSKHSSSSSSKSSTCSPQVPTQSTSTSSSTSTSVTSMPSTTQTDSSSGTSGEFAPLSSGEYESTRSMRSGVKRGKKSKSRSVTPTDNVELAVVSRASQPSPPFEQLPSSINTHAGKDEDYAVLNWDAYNGFLDFYESGEFSDLELILPTGARYKVHRIILKESSGFFRERLTDLDTSELHLDLDDERNVFADVLRFMYSNEIVVSSNNSLPLLAMANCLVMDDLKRKTSEYIAANISRVNALDMLQRAFNYKSNEIINTCTSVIAKNFCYIHNADYSFLPPETFLAILQHPQLAVREEHELYRQIERYIDKHPGLSQEHIDGMMRSCRFVFLDNESMEKVVSNPLVPRDLIIEALMAKVKPENARDPKNPRLQPRERYGISFVFSKKTQGVGRTGAGVLDWIATQSGTKAWENPHEKQEIHVTASSIEKGSPHHLVDHEPSELWSKDVPASWFCIDLGANRLVTPTYYTVRHGGNYRADSLRTWDLQGSADGEHW
eukprot:CAMPEP_0174241140 /NCGR_PEP_ID=MMETSP0417-20130205/21972_1 /TAXON_ID=242541 /ORGANISM="Mayorella sp, Strain BSH-02190019" /LENGTH=828 /DNA_ID=CAMNT_0015320341 /DNA_START=117 /DNA_END=2600 /DNA_ORIENTATION=-